MPNSVVWTKNVKEFLEGRDQCLMKSLGMGVCDTWKQVQNLILVQKLLTCVPRKFTNGECVIQVRCFSSKELSWWGRWDAERDFEQILKEMQILRIITYTLVSKLSQSSSLQFSLYMSKEVQVSEKGCESF